jgi:hypothetical protein
MTLEGCVVRRLRLTAFALLVVTVAPVCAGAVSQEISLGLVDRGYTALAIQPSDTDPTISAQNLDHIVIYDRTAKPGNILLFLTGTGGVPPGPLRFLNRAVEHGYRAINLSYVDTPAVAQICLGANLRSDPDCAEQFRVKRIYGTDATPLIQDQPQDAIMNRFAKLLAYLAAADPQGHWDQYLEGASPIWSRIAVSGQSQGGGMAEYIAQHQLVARVIVFSGGWDHSPGSQIARWYGHKSLTPPDHWFCTYNVFEPMAGDLAQNYAALGVPRDQTFALNLPVRFGSTAHVEGISNPAYGGVWDQLLGNGAPN